MTLTISWQCGHHLTTFLDIQFVGFQWGGSNIIETRYRLPVISD